MQVCGVVSEDGRMTAALAVLTNSGDTPVRIRSIVLRDPVNLSVVGSRVAAVDHTLIGLQYGYPPHELPEGVSWEAAAEADGATVPPARASDATWNLVVGLQLADGTDSGRTDGIDVYYVSGQRSFVFRTRTSIQLQRTKCR
jgi:hypothetical protein